MVVWSVRHHRGVFTSHDSYLDERGITKDNPAPGIPGHRYHYHNVIVGQFVYLTSQHTLLQLHIPFSPEIMGISTIHGTCIH